ncbi:MAG: transposase [Chthoniobacterales bacterium]
MREHIGREHPTEGVRIFRGQPTIVFATICSRNRRPNLANPHVHDALLASWREAGAWLVGFYLIMPDHVHLFCAPADQDCAIEQWITFSKRRVRHHLQAKAPAFQAHGFHHRLRRSENYHDKWEYVRMNPVRASLVQNPEDWPYQGLLNELRW